MHAKQLTWSDGCDNSSTVAARVAGVARVHAQNVEHVPEVQAHGSHRQLQSTPLLSKL